MFGHIMYCTVIVIADWSDDKRFSDHFSEFIAWDLLKLQQIHWDHDLFSSFLCVYSASLLATTATFTLRISVVKEYKQQQKPFSFLY